MTHNQELYRNRGCHARHGFTLMEIIIVLSLIGGLMAFLIPQIVQYREQAKMGTARNELLQLKQAIVLYEQDTGKLPTSLKDLVSRPQDPDISAKWLKGGYWGGKKMIQKDPWGSAYHYKPTPSGDAPYELYSKGSSGRKAPKSEWLDVHKL